MKNYDETIDTVFRRMGEYETAKKRRNSMIFRMTVPLCCLLVLGCTVLCKPTLPTVTPSTTEAPTTAYNDHLLVATDSVPQNLDVVVINTIDAIPDRQRMNIALMGNDFIPMDQSELSAYYGTNVFPTVPGDLSHRDAAYGIFQRSDGEIYWDCNQISFSNEDDSRHLAVNVDCGHIPVDFCNLFDKTEDYSFINGVQVGVGITDYGAYYAEFLLNETGFCVFAEGLDKKEFIDIIKSLTA